MKHLTKARNWSALIFALALVSCEAQFDNALPLQDDVQSIEQKPSLIPGKYIVVLKEESINFRKTDKYEDNQAAMRVLSNDLAARYGVSNSNVDKVYGNVLSGFSAELTPEQAIEIAQDSKVAYIEQDGYAYATDVVQRNATWGLDRINQTGPVLDGEYSYNSPGSDVTAYIFDTGIRYDHSEFGGRASQGFDAFGGNGSDVHGHGTHVAGTVGGITYGLAKKVKLKSVKVLNDSGSGSYSGIIAGIDWVIASITGPSVINMSIQGYGDLASVNQAFQSAFNNGIVLVVAAGNFNDNACLQVLASIPVAISVGATTNTDARAYYSNYGSCIDIFAPGSDITSSDVDGTHSLKSGTSMASPHVAGAAVLYLSKKQTATPQEVSDYLMGNATLGIVTNSNSANNNLLFTGKKPKSKN